MNAHQLAQGINNPVIPGSLGSGGGAAGAPALGAFIGSIIGLLIIAGFIFAFIFLLTGGLSWVTSGGDKAKLESARDRITNAIIGLIVVAASWAVMTLVGDFVGITFPNLPIPSVTD